MFMGTAPAGAVYRLGMSGIPVINVNNNCSTGSTALFLARQAIEGGVAECVLAVGFGQIIPERGRFEDRPNPLEKFIESADEIEGKSKVQWHFGCLTGRIGTSEKIWYP